MIIFILVRSKEFNLDCVGYIVDFLLLARHIVKPGKQMPRREIMLQCQRRGPQRGPDDLNGQDALHP
jgi:hypothetical protein